jgi:6-phosphogluconate dehydrogenase
MDTTEASRSALLADIGLIGLAVMGQNLALNIADNGYSIAVYNRTVETTNDFAERATEAQDVRATQTIEEFVAAVARPRKLLLLVKAGAVVDTVIGQLLPHLDDGDIVIDCGNSLYTDSERRTTELAGHGVRFVGSGVSGGEEGARFGPSIMPGGDPTTWDEIRPILQAISAKAGPNNDEPCCSWLGNGGSGHYVKMVHNGIEYGDMQVLAEAHLVLAALGQAPKDMARTFADWNEGRLQSYLVEISSEILDAVDDDGTPMIDVILDAAGQKGTGKWTVISAMELGQPVMLVAEAVGARIVSSFVETRATAEGLLTGPAASSLEDLTVDQLESAVYAAKLISYAQGFMLLSAASDENFWDLDLGAIAGLWRGGCIIRAAFLDDITAAYANDVDLENLLFDPVFAERVNADQGGLRATVLAATKAGIAIPAMASALAFYDGFRKARGSANLIQAQRDYFGAHTFERVDRPRGEWFHRDWANTGAAATSGSYSA